MRKRALIHALLFLAVVFSAFLANNPHSVFGEGDENGGPIWGEIEFSPASGNVLGSIVTLKVTVFYNKERVDFDARQIPEKIRISPLEVRDIDRVIQKSGEYTIDVWEFKVQYLAGNPPIELKVPSLSLQYKKKDVSYFSYFEISPASVSFIALVAENSPPDPIVKKLPFSNKAKLTGLLLFGFGGAFFLSGLGLIILFWRKERAEKRALKITPIDEFEERYNLLCQSLKQGENALKALDSLYRLLRSYYKERRGMQLKMDWWEDLPEEEEKRLIKELQSLYGEDSVSRAHALDLLERAKNILGEANNGNPA